MKRFENKSAFITGAGGYIGGTTARMLAAEGAKVAVCDITEEACARTVREIAEAGGTALAVPADVTDSACVDAAIAKTAAAFGGLDIMVHVAGGSARQDIKPLADQSDEVILSVLGVNLLGALWASRAAARVMRDHGTVAPRHRPRRTPLPLPPRARHIQPAAPRGRTPPAPRHGPRARFVPRPLGRSGTLVCR